MTSKSEFRRLQDDAYDQPRYFFWLKDIGLPDLDNLPEPDELAGEMEAGLSSFSMPLKNPANVMSMVLFGH